MDRIIQMIFRMVIRKVMNKGISAGVNRMTRGKEDRDPQVQKPPQMGQDMKKRANMMRRFGKF